MLRSYNFYDTCPHDLLAVKVSELSDDELLAAGLFAPIDRSILKDLGFVCILESVGGAFLDASSVQKAIHVTQANVTDWNVCGAVRGESSVHSRQLVQLHRDDLRRRGMLEPNNDLGELYKKLIKQIPVLIYSGDVDQCVPYYYSDNWVRTMGYAVKEEWRAWSYGDKDNSWVGGYVTTFDEPNGFTFLTIKDGPSCTHTSNSRRQSSEHTAAVHECQG